MDTVNCAKTVGTFPQAKFYRDFRVMFDEMGKSIDAVDVATPDHFHAIAESHAMRLGKHVYGQKPLAQTVYEARYCAIWRSKPASSRRWAIKAARRTVCAAPVECIQAGIIGQVHEAHIWTNRPIWPQGMGRPPAPIRCPIR